MFTIQWNKKALKQLIRFPRNDRFRITRAVDDLAAWPNCQQVKALKNHEYGYRLRVGGYRVMFDIETSIQIISIEEVKKRDERTY